LPENRESTTALEHTAARVSSSDCAARPTGGAHEACEERSSAPREREKLLGLAEHSAYALLWLGFTALRFSSIAEKSPIYTGDKRIWATIAEAPLLSREFLLPRRPILYPLLFKTGLSDAEVVLVQTVLSVFGWGLLAYSLTKFFWRPARIPIFGVTLLTALVTPVRAWDLVIRAESTSNSTIALTLAAALLFLHSLGKPGSQNIVWAGFTCLFGTSMAMARDSNPYILLLLVPAMAFAAYVTRIVRDDGSPRGIASVLFVLGWLTLSALGAQWTARAAPRFDFPLMNVIFQRVLPDAEKRAFFATELGMPINQQLLSRTRKFASSNHRYAYTEPQLEPFREWVFTRGYASYERYLITHLGQTIAEAYTGFSAVVGYNPVREGRATETGLTQFADQVLVAGVLKENPLIACVALSLLGIVSLFHKKPSNKALGAILIFLVCTTLTQLYICYHADAMEVTRHSLGVGLALRLGVVLGIALLLNLLVGFWSDSLRAQSILSRRFSGRPALAGEHARGS
jgi:hypothetical protein